MTESDVIIVGAGMSGLSAARLLSLRGLNVVVLEATDRAGGSHAIVGGDSDLWAGLDEDWTLSGEEHLLRMLGVGTGQRTEGATRKRKFCFFYQGKRKKYRNLQSFLHWSHPIASWDMAIVRRRLKLISRALSSDKPWAAPKAEEWDSISFKEFLDQNCSTKFTPKYLSTVHRIYTAAPATQMSLLNYLWDLQIPKQKKGVATTQDTTTTVPSDEVDKMVAELGSSVVLSQPVVNILHDSSAVTVRTLNGLRYSCQHLILAIPPLAQLKIHFDPALTATRTCLLENSNRPLLMRCVVVYENPFWEKKGFNGCVVCVDENKAVTAVSPVKMADTAQAALCCHIYQKHALRLADQTETDIKEEVCKCLSKFFNTKKALNPVRFAHKEWTTDQYQSGGFNSFYSPGVMTSCGEAIRAPIGSRVFLAGRNTASLNRTRPLGAVGAGHRAAREVLHARGLILEDEVWTEEKRKRHRVSCCLRITPSIALTVKAVGVVCSLVAGLVVD